MLDGFNPHSPAVKKSSSLTLAAVIIVALSASVLLVQQSRLALLSLKEIRARLWNAYEDARLRYVVLPETFSGTIDGISPTNDSLLLSITATCGLPIAIDPEQRGRFWDGAAKVGDRVTVSVRSRVSPSRKYGQYYLRKIHVDFAGPRHAALPQPLPDFSKPVRLSITPQRRSSGLAFAATTELAPGKTR